jgi:hypothetical protein
MLNSDPSKHGAVRMRDQRDLQAWPRVSTSNLTQAERARLDAHVQASRMHVLPQDMLHGMAQLATYEAPRLPSGMNFGDD